MIRLLALFAGVCTLFGATVVGCVQLGNSAWSIAVCMGGIFTMFAWVAWCSSQWEKL